jgi:hypothetical protein
VSQRRVTRALCFTLRNSSRPGVLVCERGIFPAVFVLGVTMCARWWGGALTNEVHRFYGVLRTIKARRTRRDAANSSGKQPRQHSSTSARFTHDMASGGTARLSEAAVFAMMCARIAA